MQPLHQQLGLDQISPPAVLETIDKISDGLHGYSDNGPVSIKIKKRLKPSTEAEPHTATLRSLDEHDIISYKFYKSESPAGPSNFSKSLSIYSVSIKNRYKFEQLRTELSQLYDPLASIRTETPNLVYYDAVTGEGSVNGNRVKFNKKSKQKALFELLFAHAGEPVPRERVAAILRLGNSHTLSDRLNTAISNLCTKCGVKRDVITVDKTVTLNAVAITENTLS